MEHQQYQGKINLQEYFSDVNNYKKLKRKQKKFFDLGTQSLSKYTYQLLTPVSKKNGHNKQLTETSQHLPSISGKNTATEPNDISGDLELQHFHLSSLNNNNSNVLPSNNINNTSSLSIITSQTQINNNIITSLNDNSLNNISNNILPQQRSSQPDLYPHNSSISTAQKSSQNNNNRRLYKKNLKNLNIPSNKESINSNNNNNDQQLTPDSSTRKRQDSLNFVLTNRFVPKQYQLSFFGPPETDQQTTTANPLLDLQNNASQQTITSNRQLPPPQPSQFQQQQQSQQQINTNLQQLQLQPQLLQQQQQQQVKQHSHRSSLMVLIQEQEKQIENPQKDKQQLQQGLDLVVFDHINQKRALVQPKFMQQVGSMCVSELWNEQMRQELIQFQIKARKRSSIMGLNQQQLQNSNNQNDSSERASLGLIKESKKVRTVAENKNFFSVYRPNKMEEEKNVVLKANDLNKKMQISNLSFDQLVHTFGLKSKRFKNLSPFLSRRESVLGESPTSPRKKQSHHSNNSNNNNYGSAFQNNAKTLLQPSFSEITQKKIDLIQTRCQEMIEVTIGMDEFIDKKKKDMNDYLNALKKLHIK